MSDFDQKWARLTKMGQIRDFIRSDFSAFWPCPIFVLLRANLTYFGFKSNISAYSCVYFRRELDEKWKYGGNARKYDDLWWKLMKFDEKWWNMMKSDEIWWKRSIIWCRMMNCEVLCVMFPLSILYRAKIRLIWYKMSQILISSNHLVATVFQFHRIFATSLV